MDIKRAKQEIKDAVEAYLLKDAFGEYEIPAIRQRPVLLMGPPGVGKTQVMEQIAKELRIGLVAYTITHHTRQSAVGLPFIKEKEYGGEKYSVTEYTMSEIIASVYEKMEKTGMQEGILFIDEINCVSETLAPAMLQFLQGKTFGTHKVPDGWIIVAAGNPPEYNKSVREFDVVTLDRLKKIGVEADFPVWKEYAYRQGIHPAVISYLELRRENFYRIENTVDGKLFATARGWEDLSQLIQVYEKLDKTADRDVVYQYIQHRMIAKDFANYLELYYKYRTDYKVEDILNGRWDTNVLQKIGTAPFDEHLSIVSLMSGRLGEMFRECHRQDAYVAKLYEYLIYYRENQSVMMLDDVRMMAEKDLAEQKKAEVLTREQENTLTRVIDALTRFSLELKGELFADDAAFVRVRELFGREKEELDSLQAHASETLENAFRFMEDAFGESQEMVAFVTELNANYYSVWFIRENGCDLYYRYNKGLLFDERHQDVVKQMDEAETMLNAGIK
ncbi:MAG TPA: AAA family ATPase [Candidatus Mediterraneibacter intestinipullorum]|nr:AAA family ATPase [Candidatus Mediterraneibacter intestinipullorum]